jgi:hypothetical protein
LVSRTGDSGYNPASGASCLVRIDHAALIDCQRLFRPHAPARAEAARRRTGSVLRDVAALNRGQTRRGVGGRVIPQAQKQAASQLSPAADRLIACHRRIAHSEADGARQGDASAYIEGLVVRDLATGDGYLGRRRNRKRIKERNPATIVLPGIGRVSSSIAGDGNVGQLELAVAVGSGFPLKSSAGGQYTAAVWIAVWCVRQLIRLPAGDHQVANRHREA